jgi:arylsulfatase
MSKREERPNIMVILADDLGWSDIGAYGAEIRTPHLDRLAGNGLRFTHMYNTARCCPSRASLLTGLYPHQAGIGHMVVNMGIPEYQGYLNKRCVTMAEVLKNAGYRTLMAGKWHVGGEQANIPDNWYPDMPGYPTPCGRGFDRFYGILSGGGSYYNPNLLMDDRTRIMVDTPDYHLTDAISSKASQFVEEASFRPEPFLLYLAYTAPHWPLHAWPEDIERYRGIYRDGWDKHRSDRYERQKSLGLIDPGWDISPREAAVPAWEDTEYQDWRDLQMSVYAAQIEQMDRGIGKVIDTLKECGEWENTLILFMSDNGGCAEFLQEDSNNPDPSKYDHPTVDGREVRIGNSPKIAPGPPDTFASVDIAWANLSNTPFRLFKRYTHEGGISTPLIASWPKEITNAGIIDEAAHFIDILPTLLEVSGASYPKTFKGNDIRPLEGESFAPVFHGKKWRRQAPICWEHEGSRAIRIGEWKLVSETADPTGPESRAVWELYHMKEDRTELNDRSASETGRCSRMIRLYNEWAQRCGVRPWPIPNTPRPSGMELRSRHNHSFRVPPVRLGPLRRGLEPGSRG